MGKLQQIDIEELAISLCQYKIIDNIEDLEEEEIHNMVFDEYGIEWHDFEKLIKDIHSKLKLSISLFDSEPFIGFVNEKENTISCKKHISSDFINSIINYISEGDVKDIDQKGFLREVRKLSTNEIDYELIVRKPKKD